MMQWYAVHTKPSREEMAVENLQRQGYPTYLPRQRRVVRHARKREVVLRPLFQRYLFVGIDRARTAWRPVLSTFGVAGVVCGGGEPLPVASEVIELLKAREREGAFDVTSILGRLKPGDRVRVSDGPFADFVGRIVVACTAARVTILLEFLGRVVKAEVPAVSIEAV
jgi:transcriptional antiterminator RfaH